MEERNRLRHQIDCDAIDFFRQKERDEKKCEVSKLRIPLRPGVIEELSDALKRQNVVLSTDLSIYWPSDNHSIELVVTGGEVEKQVASTETLSIQLPETIKKSKIVMEKLKGRSGSLVAYQEASNRVREHVNRLKAQFRRNTKPRKTLCRQANGRLDPKQLYRSSYDPCIFKKQAPGRPDQVLVVLLLDGSGSMIEKNAYKRALETAVMFKEGFEGSKDIDVRVYGHTSDEEQEICVVSDFGIGAEAKASLAQYFPGMSNFDYLAIYATASKMARHPASRRILVSISDGLPCAPTQGPCINAVKATADAVQDIRQKGWTVFGVEIGKHSGNMIYGPEWNLSVSAESLPSTMGLLITNLLRRARL
jgi:Mg-chelatase subunit ChlD